MARLLLTGASGLIGRAVAARLLAEGHEVLALTRGGDAPGDVIPIACDLLDARAVSRAVATAKADRLIHLAWHAGARDRWTAPANLDWMAATLHLVQAFARAGGQRALCAGSCAEYDWSTARLSEDTPLRPATLYGAAKAGTGLALTRAAPHLGLSLVWARIFFVFGPGEPEGRLLGDLVAGLRRGEAVATTDGVQRRDFVSSQDLAEMLCATLASKAEGALNVASGTAIPVRDLIGEIAAQLGRPDLVRFGVRARPAHDPDCLEADIARLTAEVGPPSRGPLPQVVAQVLEAWP